MRDWQEIDDLLLKADIALRSSGHHGGNPYHDELGKFTTSNGEAGSGSGDAGDGAATKAKRGDLVVFVGKSSSSYINGPDQESVRITVGEVTSVTRDGEVKEYRDLEAGNPQELEYSGNKNAKRYILPKGEFDTAAIEKMVKSRGILADSKDYKPFESIDELKEAIRPHRVMQRSSGHHGGNPYHDELGKFTTSNGKGSATTRQPTNGTKEWWAQRAEMIKQRIASDPKHPDVGKYKRMLKDAQSMASEDSAAPHDEMPDSVDEKDIEVSPGGVKVGDSIYVPNTEGTNQLHTTAFNGTVVRVTNKGIYAKGGSGGYRPNEISHFPNGTTVYGGSSTTSAGTIKGHHTGQEYPVSGTWESPRGSILTQVEKVNREHLRKMYDAESKGEGLSELSRQTDAKTNNAFNLGYLK